MRIVSDRDSALDSGDTLCFIWSVTFLHLLPAVKAERWLH